MPSTTQRQHSAGTSDSKVFVLIALIKRCFPFHRFTNVRDQLGDLVNHRNVCASLVDQSGFKTGGFESGRVALSYPEISGANQPPAVTAQ